MNNTFDFAVDKDNKTITVKREFPARLPLVWDAHTKSYMLDQWWAPKPWTAHTKLMDFREGGTWLYAMRGPNGEEHWSIANFDKIEDQKRYAGLSAFTDAEGKIDQSMPKSNWDVTFTSQGDKTQVQYLITYPDTAALESELKMGFKEGFEKGLQNLEELLPTLGK